MSISDNKYDEIKKEAEKENVDIHKKLLRYIGLAKKAGAVSAGVNIAINLIQSKKAYIVFYSEDISKPSLKKLKDKSDFYNTKIYNINLTMDALGHLVGLTRPAAAICITNKNFFYPIESLNLELLNRLSSKSLKTLLETEEETKSDTEVH